MMLLQMVSSTEWNNCDPYDGGLFTLLSSVSMTSKVDFCAKCLKKLLLIQKEVKSCFVDTFEVEEIMSRKYVITATCFDKTWKSPC